MYKGIKIKDHEIKINKQKKQHFSRQCLIFGNKAI